jgi:hypothetical protein
MVARDPQVGARGRHDQQHRDQGQNEDTYQRRQTCWGGMAQSRRRPTIGLWPDYVGNSLSMTATSPIRPARHG